MMEYEEYEIDLGKIFEIIQKNLIWFIVVMMLCGTAAFAATKLLMEEKFTATAKIIIVQKNDSATVQSSISYNDVQLSQKLVNTYKEILMSEAISDPVISNLDLYDLYEIDTEAYEEIVEISDATNTEVMSISVETNDPKLSADIANEIVSVFQSRIYSIMQIENVSVLNNAKVPTEKSGPSGLKNTAIGLVIGMFICACIGVIPEFKVGKGGEL